MARNTWRPKDKNKVRVVVKNRDTVWSYERHRSSRARAGRHLRVEKDGVEMILTGREINTVKRILRETGEI